MIVEQQSVVHAPADRVWARVITLEGINHELRPWLTMSMPRDARTLTVQTMPVGVPVGRCWMRLFGVLPFDFDRLCIEKLYDGEGFDEESTMLSMRRWRHERRLTPLDQTKTVVRDHLTFDLRAPLRPATPAVAAGIRALFAHRQRRLQEFFAGLTG